MKNPSVRTDSLQAEILKPESPEYKAQVLTTWLQRLKEINS
jgi:hypothetical protein